jgi:hypothetical protein
MVHVAGWAPARASSGPVPAFQAAKMEGAFPV